jgi:hypothetical protein
MPINWPEIIRVLRPPDPSLGIIRRSELCRISHYGKSAASVMRLSDHQALRICGRVEAHEQKVLERSENLLT